MTEKALASGASECHIVDLKEEFVKDYIYPTIATGAIYEGTYLLGTSMARPIIAKAQVEVARKVGADALCHGCTGKGNDQVRFEGCFAALAPDLKVIAPWREWTMESREDLLAYLAERNIKTSLRPPRSIAATPTPGISPTKVGNWKIPGMSQQRGVDHDSRSAGCAR